MKRRIQKIKFTVFLLMIGVLSIFFSEALAQKVMTTVPPKRDEQVTYKNYRTWPYSTWAFRNIGAVLHTVMVPRGGDIYRYPEKYDPSLGELKARDAEGNLKTVIQILEENHADGFLVLKDGAIRFEKYFNGLTKDYGHIWFSATKSLTSTAFGILVAQGKVNLNDSPAKYVPELKGSAFERVTIQQVLNHSTALAIKENYTDPNSDFVKYYGPALGLAFFPGAQDAQPEETEIYGIHDFVAKFVKPDPNLKPDEVFDYNSTNTDMLGWLLARVSGMTVDRFVQKHIWSKLETEHDASWVVDRACMATAGAGFVTTLRDAARFGDMILHRGKFHGKQIVPADWVDQTIQITEKDKERMRRNEKYQNDPYIAYKNMWWILDETKGEYMAVGIHGQVIYINRDAGVVIPFFSSQPGASAAGNKHFWSKISACRAIAEKLK